VSAHKGSRRGIAQLLAVAILLAGLALSAGAALLWRASVRSHERQVFSATASDVTATLATELRRDTDFVATLRALLTMQPNLSATRFDEWYAQLEGGRRQVGSLATAVVSIVPARELGAFKARHMADPAFRALAGGGFEIVPAGRRPRYCLLSAGLSRLATSLLVAIATHADWCTSAIAGVSGVLESETDSGQFAVSPPRVGTVFIGAAVYRHGASLSSVAARRSAVIGWIWNSVDMPAVIKTALGVHRGLAVTLYHRDANRGVEGAGMAGTAGAGATLTHSTTLDIDGTWIARVQGAPVVSGLSSGVQGLLVFLGGAIVSALLSALAFMLMRSRQRALGLVDERTGQLRHQALHDALTGLPNRVLALDRAEHMLARARQRNAPTAALHVDLDGFKQINDTFGHAAGDELLKIVAARLASIVRGADTAARLGGDEFVVLTEGPSLDAGPELVAERLLEVLRVPYELGSEEVREVSLTATVGIAFGMRESAGELLRDADVALHEGKAAGKNRQVMFESSMHAAAKDRLELEMDLAGALDRQELFLLYQPMFDLRTEELVGVEALLRWRHPARGVLCPDDFVPIAEESDLIVSIGRWALNAACRQAFLWHEGGHQIGMSVNVCARQLDGDALVEEVGDALRASGLEPTALTLEVTETTLMRDTEQTTRRLGLLKQLGVRIAVDDFGTGYSSLAYLRQFPVDALKIDRSFVAGIASSRESAVLVRTLVALGKALGLETLAEGIEQQAQLRALQREQCDYGQGYLFAHPLQAQAVEEMLDAAEERGRAPAPRS
jgi:diguanylate cyclase (GGDEF)-like protein